MVEVVTELVSIGWVYGLLFDDTKPAPDQMNHSSYFINSLLPSPNTNHGQQQLR